MRYEFAHHIQHHSSINAIWMIAVRWNRNEFLEFDDFQFLILYEREKRRKIHFREYRYTHTFECVREFAKLNPPAFGFWFFFHFHSYYFFSFCDKNMKANKVINDYSKYKKVPTTIKGDLLLDDNFLSKHQSTKDQQHITIAKETVSKIYIIYPLQRHS